MDKRLIAIIAVVLVVIVVVAIFVIMEPRPEAKITTLVIGTTDKLERGLEPGTAAGMVENLWGRQICDSLYIMDPVTLETSPMLASDMPTVSASAMNWTIPLRQDVKFTDGTPFNASCVKFSFERYINLSGPNQGIYFYMIDNVEVLDTYSVRIDLKMPFAGYLNILASGVCGIISPSAVMNMGEEQFAARPVASGPFKVVSWLRDQELVLEANKDYWGEKPKTDEILLLTYPDQTTLELAIVRGDIDLAYDQIADSAIPSLQNNTNLNVIGVPSTNNEYIAFNMLRVPLTVRQAIMYAINYDDLISRCLYGNGVRALSCYSNQTFAFKPVLAMYNYDPAKAKQLLSGLGYTPQNPLNLQLMYSPSVGAWTANEVVAIKEYLAAVGINVDINAVEWATFLNLWSQKSFDMVYCGWTVDYPDPDPITGGMLTSTSWAGSNGSYNNTRVDELAIDGREETVQTDRVQIYYEIQDIIAQDLPYAWTVNKKLFAVARTNVGGFVYSPYCYLTDFSKVYKT